MLMKTVKKRNTGNKSKKSSSPRTRRGKLVSAGYLFPSILGVLLFFVLPFMIVIFYSVVDNPISRQFVFFDNLSRCSKITPLNRLPAIP